MPTALSDFIPHRECLPLRYCEECNAILSTGNETDTCSPCVNGWGRYNVLWHQDFGNALADFLADA